MSDLLTAKEAAAMLGVEFQTLANWRVRGKGPRFLRLYGWRVMYRRRDVEAFIEERDRAAEAA